MYHRGEGMFQLVCVFSTRLRLVRDRLQHLLKTHTRQKRPFPWCIIYYYLTSL